MFQTSGQIGLYQIENSDMVVIGTDVLTNLNFYFHKYVPFLYIIPKNMQVTCKPNMETKLEKKNTETARAPY